MIQAAFRGFNLRRKRRAAICGQLEGLQNLLQRGANVFLAAKSGNVKELARCLAVLETSGVSADATDDDGATALHYAARYGRLEGAQYLLRRGVTVDAQNDDKHTALLIAAMYGHVAVVQELVKHGANTSLRDCYGLTPYLLAKKNGHGASISAAYAPLRRTICDFFAKTIQAAYRGFRARKTIAALRREGKNRAKNISLQNRIFGAARLGNVKELATCLGVLGATDDRVFIKTCSDMLDATDDFGSTALHHAAFCGRLEVAQHLLRRGATVDVLNDYKDTPLHLAATNGHVAVMQQLVEYGADPGLTNLYGKTPGDLAEKNGHRPAIRAEGHMQAAKKIQAAYRFFRAKKYVRQHIHKILDDPAKRIQAAYRGFKVRATRCRQFHAEHSRATMTVLASIGYPDGSCYTGESYSSERFKYPSCLPDALLIGDIVIGKQNGQYDMDIVVGEFRYSDGVCIEGYHFSHDGSVRMIVGGQHELNIVVEDGNASGCPAFKVTVTSKNSFLNFHSCMKKQSESCRSMVLSKCGLQKLFDLTTQQAPRLRFNNSAGAPLGMNQTNVWNIFESARMNQEELNALDHVLKSKKIEVKSKKSKTTMHGGIGRHHYGNPKMMKHAQKMMSKMSPEQIEKMRETQRNLSPDQLQKMQEQAKNITPSLMKAAIENGEIDRSLEQMEGMTHEEITLAISAGSADLDVIRREKQRLETEKKKKTIDAARIEQELLRQEEIEQERKATAREKKAEKRRKAKEKAKRQREEAQAAHDAEKAAAAEAKAERRRAGERQRREAALKKERKQLQQSVQKKKATKPWKSCRDPAGESYVKNDKSKEDGCAHLIIPEKTENEIHWNIAGWVADPEVECDDVDKWEGERKHACDDSSDAARQMRRPRGKRGGNNKKRREKQRERKEEAEAAAEAARLQKEKEAAAKQARLEAARQQKKKEEAEAAANDNLLCIICMDKPQTHAFMPCGHRCACAQCADRCLEIKPECPKCKQAVEFVAKIFI